MWNISYYGAAVAASAGNGVNAGLFVPLTDLPGIVLSEVTDVLLRQKKIAFSLANKIYSKISTLGGGLGIAVNKPSPGGAGIDLITQNFGFTTTYVTDHRTNTNRLYPLPASQLGQVSLINIFPNSQLIVSEAAIPSVGILIPDAEITSYGGSIPASTSVDARSYFAAFYHSMINNAEVDNIGITVSERQTPDGIDAPANLTTITSYTISDIPYLSIFTRLNSITFRLQLNQETQAFDVI